MRALRSNIIPLIRYPHGANMKALLYQLYIRVIVAYKSTLLGIFVTALGVAVDTYVNSPNKIVSVVAAIAGSVLVLLKPKYPPPPPDSLRPAA